MQVFKFGGASIKDAKSVKNLVNVLNKTGYKNTLIVVSAMGKTTNALEVVIKNYFAQSKQLQSSVQDVFKFHNSILLDLFDDEKHEVFTKVSDLFNDLKAFLDRNKSPDYNFVYDQVIGFGELVSSTIVSEYLNDLDIKNKYLDVREFIKTDNYYRSANVNWEDTQKRISANFNRNQLNITQGFLGSDANNFTTTLGREGSDYTAAIFAYCLNAESVTIWKDVPGVLNADPRYFTKTLLLNRISYREAIELAFYGASVIHPKTLQPLQRKEIPLFVKSFLNPTAPGTCVGKGDRIDPETSCFILKKELVQISLSSLDFSFMMEDNIGDVFKWLHTYKMKVELIQNSAISFSVCVNDKFGNLEILLAKLQEKFRVKWNENVTLYTIRHFNPTEVKALAENKNVLLKQESKETVQLVIKE